jgi:outer membrane biosynthesis protein TonB
MSLGVSIDVVIGANGAPASARVIEPSGDMGFDRASIDAALRSTYTPAKAKCAVVLGHYTFTETLGPIP